MLLLLKITTIMRRVLKTTSKCMHRFDTQHRASYWYGCCSTGKLVRTACPAEWLTCGLEN